VDSQVGRGCAPGRGLRVSLAVHGAWSTFHDPWIMDHHHHHWSV